MAACTGQFYAPIGHSLSIIIATDAVCIKANYVLTAFFLFSNAASWGDHRTELCHMFESEPDLKRDSLNWGPSTRKRGPENVGPKTDFRVVLQRHHDLSANIFAKKRVRK